MIKIELTSHVLMSLLLIMSLVNVDAFSFHQTSIPARHVNTKHNTRSHNPSYQRQDGMLFQQQNQGEQQDSSGIGIDIGIESVDTNKDINVDMDMDMNMNMNRRKAFLTMMATATSAALIQQEAASAASTIIDGSKDTLEDINIGKGLWASSSPESNKNSMTLNGSIPVSVPSIFITYMTRLLINYDTSINDWWYNDISYKYSLVENDERNVQLNNEFSSLAKSIELSLLDYISTSSINNLGDSSATVNDVRNRFESLLSLFVDTYGDNSNTNNEMGERMNQIILLFSMLSIEYQPLNGLKKLMSSTANDNNSNSSSNSQTSIEYDQDLAKLLPTNIYTSVYNPSKQSYTITPSIPGTTTTPTSIISQQDLNSSTNTNTVFGSIAAKPLNRQTPNLSFGLYSLLGLCGATGCAVTHSLVIPFDVVKTRLQTNPDQYESLIDGIITIAKEDTVTDSDGTTTGGGGLNAFLLGSQATIVGYFWYGLSVYPTYSFSKWYLTHEVFDSASAFVNMNLISLIAGAIAAVVASVGLTPVEAARIRTVAEPKIYRELGLIGTLDLMSKEDEKLGWKTLYAGFPSLVTRQVIFG
jgi:hypothetical protein